MNSKIQSGIFPLEITNGEHNAIKIHRTLDAKAEDKEKTRPLVANSVNKLLRVTGLEKFQIHETESNFPQTIPVIFKSLGRI